MSVTAHTVSSSHICAHCRQPMAARPGANWAGLICANTACETCDPVVLMKAVLDDLEESFDKEIYPEQVKEDFDAPDDREYSVTISAKQWRALGRAIGRYEQYHRTDEEKV